MRQLVSAAINAPLSLGQCVKQWKSIARRLTEPKRKRTRQLDMLTELCDEISDFY